MEGKPAKRRRIYSLEPNRIAQAMFATKYVNYFVPALMKIKENSSEGHKISPNCDDLKNSVRYEADKAMAFSAQGFAWSNALKINLEGISKSFVPLNLSSNPSSEDKKLLIRTSKGLPEINKNQEGMDESDEDISSRLMSLRKLLPGGEEMYDEEVITESESYISCLQMQVNILQCLADQIR